MLSSRDRFPLAVVVAVLLPLALLGAGCGRTSMFFQSGADGGVRDGASPDGAQPDGGPRDGGQHDGPCAPECADLCGELATCGYDYPGGLAVCANDCQTGRWNADTVSCLVNGYCQPDVSCATFRQCVQHPNRSCDDVCDFVQLCGFMSAEQCLPLCGIATPEQRACFSRALDEESCDELRGCIDLRTPCQQICDFAIDACGANVPRGQCIAYCEEQTPSAIQCELRAVNQGDCGELANCFENPPDDPDLVVADFYAFVQGANVYYVATICNQGGADAAAFDVELYYDRPGPPAAGLTGDDARAVAGVQAGSCQSVQFVRANTADGTYRSWIQADAFGQVVESDEGNNVGGPYEVNVGGTNQCAAICEFARFCNVMEYTACMQQCPLWPPDEIACASKAAQNGDCGSLKQCITGPQFFPDLVIASFTAQVAGGTVTWRATVCNQGNVAADGFYVDLYYDRTTAPPPWEFGDDFQPVSGLQPLQCQDLTFTRTGTAVGAYQSWLQVDADNYVDESNEQNNVAGPVAVNVVPLPQPDLTITGFTASVVGTTVTYQVTVCNQGTAAAGATVVDLYYDRTTAPSTYVYGDQFENVPALGAGSCASVTLTRANTPGGTYRSWTQVDANGSIAESDEANNVGGPRVVNVEGPTLQADLVVQSLNATVFERTVTYTAVVCNLGAAPAGGFNLDFFYNRAAAPTVGQVGDDRRHLNSLGAGQCASRSITQTNTAAGSYTAWAFVDSGATVAESNEGNNAGGPTPYTVDDEPPPNPGVDLVVAACNATVFEGSVTYEIVVCNSGTQSAGQFVVGVYYDQHQAPAEGEAAQAERDVNNLGAGQCTSRTIVRSNTPDGVYTSWCQVDVWDDVAESSETNNVGGPITVTVTGSVTGNPDLLVQSFLATVSGDTVTYTAEVCNVGEVAASGFYVDLFYDLANPPTTGMFGNQSQGVASLAPQECRTLTFVRTATPSGSYRSWCEADSAQAVVENNEANNVAGPAEITISAPLDCDLVCTWMTEDCGLPSFLYSVCTTLCGGLPADRHSCVQEAMTAGDCNATWACLQ